jgi:hypothetical protein
MQRLPTQRCQVISNAARAKKALVALAKNADYGFTAPRADENEAIVEAASGMKRLTIKVLDEKSSGIYVCVTEPGENGGEPKAQSVVLLKRKNPNTLVKVHESSREFAACPAIGGSDSATTSNGDGD